MASKFFPVGIDLQGKNILVVGAGKIAWRKVKTLLNYGCRIRVITQEVKEQNFLKLAEENKIEIQENTTFSEQDLNDIFLVVAATSDEKINRDIARICMEKNILVNNISSKEEMNLRFQSIYETEHFQISISANGNPKKAKELREQIQKFFEQDNKKQIF